MTPVARDVDISIVSVHVEAYRVCNVSLCPGANTGKEATAILLQ